MAPKMIVAMVLACAAACSSLPPQLSGPDLASRIRAAVPGTEGDIEVFGGAGWYPYVDSRNARPHERPFKGAVVITDAGLLFVIWDEDLQRIDVARRIPLADIRTIGLDHLGRTPVLQLHLRDRNVHSFGFGEGRDPQAAERAAASLEARLARKERPA